jgi:hypothetical protein
VFEKLEQKKNFIHAAILTNPQVQKHLASLLTHFGLVEVN